MASVRASRHAGQGCAGLVGLVHEGPCRYSLRYSSPALRRAFFSPWPVVDA